MIADVLRKITYDGLTNVREIAELTGRGESTVYRWINGESQPDFTNIRTLANGLSSKAARQRLVDLFTQAMPVTIQWSEHNGSEDGSNESPDGLVRQDSVCSCIEAVNHISQAMQLLACGDPQSLKSDEILEASHLLNLAVSGLLRGRQLLERVDGAMQRQPNLA
jgi:hypothetical protein